MASVSLRSLLHRATSSTRPFVFGMIHVPALPGTPKSQLSISDIVKKVKEEASIYASAEVDGIIVENMHDVPYIQEPSIGPEVVATMTRVCMAVNEVLDQYKSQHFVKGIQILAAANKQAIAVAHACGFDFIRAECFTFGHVADEGPMSACAGPLLRYRKQIGADQVAIVTDIKKKHSSHAITSDLSIGDIAEASEFFLADGLIVTGSSTGCAASVDDLKAVLHRTLLPVFIGSGVTSENMDAFIDADAFIVGSFFKKGGHWENDLDESTICSFMEKVRQIKRVKIFSSINVS
ncbi:unnamed protein product [Anisakis simplex]|uniref:BtpA family membrane complex biogenesis protein n=1 Tax=Anisakis simplex TaxID=6269 RepID=A0A0M3JZU4_ANISI|nr:unnamed protein product [Anisakis simplex]